MTTSPSDEPHQRSKQLQGYVNEVVERAMEGFTDCEVVKPENGRPGEVQIILTYGRHRDYWRMTFCNCHGAHTGWELRLVSGIN